MLLGIITEAKLLQPEKTAMPIVVTLFGMFTEVRLLQLKKA